MFLKSGRAIERSLRGVDSRLFLELRMTRNKGEGEHTRLVAAGECVKSDF